MKISLFVLMLLLLSCAQTENASIGKLDPVLKQQVIENQKSNSGESISFIAQLSVPASTSIKDDIRSNGIEINSISKNIFTGKGNYKSILLISHKDYIKSLEANKTYAPNSNN